MILPFMTSGVGAIRTIPTGTPSVNVTGTKVIQSGADGLGWYGRTAVEVHNGVIILVYREGITHPDNTVRLAYHNFDLQSSRWG